MQKSFISLGDGNSFLNIQYVDQDKTYFDKRIGKVALIDKYGTRFNVDPKLVKGKLKVRGLDL